MKPLIVLLTSFLILVFITKKNQRFRIALSARIALSIMLCFTAIAHFVFTEGMAMMLPAIVPFKIPIVYGTGLLEIGAAVMLHIPKYQKAIAWFLLGFFILLLPANINAAILEVDYQNGTYDGHGVAYLWFRIPLQVLFILWTYFSAIRVPMSK
ncbi:hypothetical protein [Aureispira sp. CCB-QB1]|uniref:DoxX family protein n=1 Tax=Aureispira sp. CCB-QB1 TaxID=1313421 RepID=UPI000695E449|nr:hypothetical protein [Aureispira sp. CCB-QB1]